MNALTYLSLRISKCKKLTVKAKYGCFIKHFLGIGNDLYSVHNYLAVHLDHLMFSWEYVNCHMPPITSFYLTSWLFDRLYQRKYES